MTYKTLALTGVILISVLLLPSHARAELTDRQQEAANDIMAELVEAINQGDTDIIERLVADEKPELAREIQEVVDGGIQYELDYLPLSDTAEVTEPGRMEISAKYAASAPGWNISGLRANFTLETTNGDWKIVATDFHEKLGPGYVLRFVLTVLAGIGVIILLISAFWIWMLIDCAKREFDNKTVWILIVALLHFPGALIYFFAIRWRLRRQEKQSQQT